MEEADREWHLEADPCEPELEKQEAEEEAVLPQPPLPDPSDERR